MSRAVAADWIPRGRKLLLQSPLQLPPASAPPKLGWLHPTPSSTWASPSSIGAAFIPRLPTTQSPHRAVLSSVNRHHPTQATTASGTGSSIPPTTNGPRLLHSS
ncbi:hypothetical protein CCHR01_15748 [Colletotrichum chrysophilum]|uniref:Uncharacterized protein n=1 Tax=Colletotrichum chrysophilum TaxID=1836956 RepID=A0AAD9EB39_9PEZI|nr:hypothetical protein K456DRAFT_36379 [Colletotrichum gloeosporioides 23]KAK1841623.1 hypothetical protein CCHR01_15748 [Colletotrichum chrysophilum]